MRSTTSGGLTFAKLLDKSGGLHALLRVRDFARMPWLPVLTYHRIAPAEDAGGVYGDVIDAYPEQFERQLAFLARHFHFLSIDDVVRHVRGGPLPPNPVLLTFDDGYLECSTRVLPMLQRHGARATFFVSTTYVDERRLFWWDHVAHVIGNCKLERIELYFPYRKTLELGPEGERSQRWVLSLIKKEVGLDLPRFLDHLTEASGISWSREEERELADRLVMQWSDVHELVAAGMDVQSHTRTHRVLHTMSSAELAGELSGSRRDLEERLGQRVDAVSYPVGYPIRHLPHVRAALDDAGYALGFTNQTGVNHTTARWDPFDIHRISMATEYEDVFFRAMMALPYLAPLRKSLPFVVT